MGIIKIRMTLLSDAIFGNGESVPGGEDIAVLCDVNGFPYYKGTTLKGIFGEQLVRSLEWMGLSEKESVDQARKLLGRRGDMNTDDNGRLFFSDFCLPVPVQMTIKREIEKTIREERKMSGEAGKRDKNEEAAIVRQIICHDVTETLTHTRTFTAIDETGMVKDGSLRVARCVNRGLTFYGEISCPDGSLMLPWGEGPVSGGTITGEQEMSYEQLASEVLQSIRWIGTLRNRGFGRVKFAVMEE